MLRFVRPHDGMDSPGKHKTMKLIITFEITPPLHPSDYLTVPSTQESLKEAQQFASALKTFITAAQGKGDLLSEIQNLKWSIQTAKPFISATGYRQEFSRKKE